MIPVIEETSCRVILILILFSGCVASVGAGDTEKTVDPCFMPEVFSECCSDNCRESVGTTICNLDSESLSIPVMLNKDAGIVLIDIRTNEEYMKYHIPGAVNYDYTDPFFIENLAQLNRTEPVIIYCRTGVKSGNTVPIMQELGFLCVFNMENGIEEWIRDGFPVIV